MFGRGIRMFVRVFHYIMKMAMYVIPWGMPKVIEGEDSILQLPEVIYKNGNRRVLVVADPFLAKNGYLQPLLDKMSELQLSYVVFNEVSPNPLDTEVENGVKMYIENNCDSLVAFGGGSPMDCAKAIGARIAKPKKSISQLQGLYRVLKKIPTLYAVPTTSGTGSETTVAAVITEASTHHKASINDNCLMPKYAVLDPKLTVSVPKRVTAITGLDALSHAVEAYTNQMYNTKLENDLAKEAVRLVYDYLYKAYEDGNNIDARSKMQKAAFYAGRAFTRGCVGNVHAIGHTLSGLYGMAHGEAMGILLPHVMRAYGEPVYKYLADLADVCNMCNGGTIKEKAEAFIAWIEELKEKMGISVYPTCICEADIDQMVNWAYKEAVPLYPTPVVWKKEDYAKFIDSLMKEW